MKISVIVPVYNAEKYLVECLESLVNQTYQNFEIILVNDGSTDNSSKICEEYKKKYKNIKYISIENHGVSYARNLGIAEASGDYIMFVDSDDIISLNLSSNLDSYSENIIYFNEFLDDNANEEELIKSILGLNGKKLALAGPYSKLFKRSFLIDNKIVFNEQLINGEDMIFNIECAIKNKMYKIVNCSFYRYRINMSSVTNNFKEKILENDKNFHIVLKSILNNTSFEKFLDIKKIDGLLSMLNYISMINKYKIEKKYFMLIYDNYNELDVHSYRCNFYKKTILILYLKKFYLLVYFLLKIKSVKGAKKEEFINI